MAVLEVQGLTRRFGGLTAVNELSFAVEDRAEKLHENDHVRRA